MCGLFGWVGKNPKDFNKDKFDKLGIFNISRGKHSCGVAVDGQLYKGIKDTANFQDFLVKDHYPSPTEIPVVIGHTRHATSGAWTLENAHPFKFEKEEGYVIGAHNGTLSNQKDIAAKYAINALGKIDSQILLEIIANGDVSVLSDYKGAAALLIYSSLQPDTIYIFRGESKKTQWDRREEEERPLYFYQENDDSMYISSLEESLCAITNTKEEKDTSIFEVKTNRLYEIKGGNIKNRFIIDRSKVWAEDIANYSATSTTNRRPRNHSRPTTAVNNTNTTPVKSSNSKIDTEKVDNLHYEKVIHNTIAQDIYWENGRLKKTGHLFTGICIFIKEVGFMKVCNDMHELPKALESVKYHDASIGNDLDLGDLTKQFLFYVHKGVLLKDVADYRILTVGHKKGACSAADYSYMSEYPIIDYKMNRKDIIKKNEQNIILENKLFNGEYSPIGSFFKYECRNGILVNKTELDDLVLPKNTLATVGLYDSINDDDEDDDVFEEGLATQLSLDGDSTFVDSIIEAGQMITDALTEAQALAFYSQSSMGSLGLLSIFLEYVTASQKSFEPIAKGIEELASTNEALKNDNNK